jgi:hypothetical protein
MPTMADRDIARYEMTNTAALDKRTALVMGMLYREPTTSEWCLRIISEPAMGRTAHENVDELQAATCALQPATCNLQPATFALQPALCNLRFATCALQPAPF